MIDAQVTYCGSYGKYMFQTAQRSQRSDRGFQSTWTDLFLFKMSILLVWCTFKKLHVRLYACHSGGLAHCWALCCTSPMRPRFYPESRSWCELMEYFVILTIYTPSDLSNYSSDVFHQGPDAAVVCHCAHLDFNTMALPDCFLQLSGKSLGLFVNN